MKVNLDWFGKLLAFVVWGSAGVGEPVASAVTAEPNSLVLGLALFVGGGIVADAASKLAKVTKH